MTDEQIRMAIAESVGDPTYSDYLHGKLSSDEYRKSKRNYPQDLNAIANAIGTLTDAKFKNADGFEWSQHCEFNCQLERIVYRDLAITELGYFQIINASAKQRAEAYLRTIGIWKD